MKKLKISFLLLFLCFNVFSQTSEAIDKLIQEEMQTTKIPGLALAIIKEGKLIKKTSYGLANVETQTPVNSSTIFKIASISKPMIAMAIMTLVEDGKIKLDDPVSKYLNNTPESWSKITIRHFLSHTSGVIRESPTFDPFEIQADSLVIQGAYNEPLRFAPGEKYEYCNVGYYSLADIIRKVSGKFWPEYIKKRIFSPAEMHTTQPTNFSEIIPNRANAYYLEDGKLQNNFSFLTLRPSGAFLSTLDDLILWDAAINQKNLLSKQSYQTMWTPFKLNDGKDSVYGLGWALDGKKVRHGGSLNGFKSEYVRYNDGELAIIILANLDQAIPNKIADKVAELYLGK